MRLSLYEWEIRYNLVDPRGDERGVYPMKIVLTYFLQQHAVEEEILPVVEQLAAMMAAKVKNLTAADLIDEYNGYEVLPYEAMLQSVAKGGRSLEKVHLPFLRLDMALAALRQYLLNNGLTPESVYRSRLHGVVSITRAAMTLPEATDRELLLREITLAFDQWLETMMCLSQSEKGYLVAAESLKLDF